MLNQSQLNVIGYVINLYLPRRYAEGWICRSMQQSPQVSSSPKQSLHRILAVPSFEDSPLCLQRQQDPLL